MNKSALNLLFASIALLLSCKQPVEKSELNIPKTVEQPKKDTVPVVKPIEITYHALLMKDSGRKVFKEYDEDKQLLILALNRIDKAHLRNADTLVIPDTFIADRNAYSPFPLTVSSLTSVKKIILFSYPSQTYGVYENGSLLKWGPTSMGKKSSKTPTGLFFTNWKGKEVVSTVDEEWILKWNFNISNKGGIGWHQYTMPGYPASHSCLRLYADEAKFLYDWADQWVLQNNQLIAKGTPVIVFGEYPFGSRKPWRNLLEQPKALLISETEINELVSSHLEKILAEQENSEKIRVQRKPDTTQTI